MARSRLPLLGALLVALPVLAACGTASPSDSGPSSAPASGQADSPECHAIELSGPSGEAVDLTGAWRSNDYGDYSIYQHGSCLQWLGQSHYLGEERGASWTNVFTGTIEPDFSITGRWGNVPFSVDPAEFFGSAGSLTLAITFEGSADSEYPTLEVVNATGEYGGTRLVPASSLGQPVTLDGAFGGNFDFLLQTGCIWVEADGRRYELIGDGGWIFRLDQSLRIEDERGQVLARVGDPIRVTGLVSPGLSLDCVENAILIEELDPSP